MIGMHGPPPIGGIRRQRQRCDRLLACSRPQRRASSQAFG